MRCATGRHGFCVFSMKYRTAEDGGSYPDAQVDCYAALLWLAQGSHVGEVANIKKYFESCPGSPKCSMGRSSAD